jgi:hypothetical protein
MWPRGGCSPLETFFWKKSQRREGDQGKIYPLDFLRNLRENFKGGTKGYFDLSREKTLKGGPKEIF